MVRKKEQLLGIITFLVIFSSAVAIGISSDKKAKELVEKYLHIVSADKISPSKLKTLAIAIDKCFSKEKLHDVSVCDYSVESAEISSVKFIEQVDKTIFISYSYSYLDDKLNLACLLRAFKPGEKAVCVVR